MCSVIGIWRDATAYLGASYDFYYGHGLVVTNKRGLQKQALGKNPPYHEWDVQYGSVTFNQFGRELPTCGMNEAGLSIHLLQHKNGIYPLVQNIKPKLNELQWIQYQLDCHGSVEEVLACINDTDIDKTFFDLQFALCDANGEIAFISYIDGVVDIVKGTQVDVMVLTNHNYKEAIKYYKKLTNPESVPNGNKSLVRFARLYNIARKYDSSVNAITYLFEALGMVFSKPTLFSVINWLFFRSPPVTSYWNTVFEPKSRKLYFRTNGHKNIRIIDLSEIDFSPKTPVRVLDIAKELDGDVTGHLQIYNRKDNAGIIHKSYRPLGNKISKAEQEVLVDYPDTFTTKAQQKRNLV